MDNIEKLYLLDKKQLESKEIYESYHRPEFDILDCCYGYNQRLLMENLKEKNRLFVYLQRWIQSKRKEMICKIIDVSFNITSDWIDCTKPDHLYAKLCTIEDLSVHQRVPMSLLDITAAAAVQMFKHASVQSDLLLSIFNSVKKKEIFIRCGPNHERMIYSFANIIKHFIYQKNEFEPFAPAKYFENIAMNPIPFCIHCGLFEKIQKSMCWCPLCNFLRFACVFTKKIEHPYHTKYLSQQ